MRRSLATLALGAVLFAVAAACGSDGGVGVDDGEVRVVASTALIAEFASTVAGDDAVVVGLIPAGVDLHSFEPAPGIAAAIAQADVLFVNGHGLEETLLEVIEQNASDGARIVEVSEGIETLIGGGEEGHEDGGVDPHLWLDVRNAMHYVKEIRDALIEVDPGHEEGYRERAGAYLVELEALHEEVAAELAAIPEDARRLVVFHDAYRYLAAGYGLELVASVLPAGAQQDPSAGTVAELIELVRGSGVPIVFAEPQFGAAVLERIASEADVEVGVLYSTFAGEVESYAELMRANADALVEGLAP